MLTEGRKFSDARHAQVLTGRALQLHTQGVSEGEGFSGGHTVCQSHSDSETRSWPHPAVEQKTQARSLVMNSWALLICLFHDSLWQHPRHCGAGVKSLRLWEVCPEAAWGRRQRAKDEAYRQSWIWVLRSLKSYYFGHDFFKKRICNCEYKLITDPWEVWCQQRTAKLSCMQMQNIIYIG